MVTSKVTKYEIAKGQLEEQEANVVIANFENVFGYVIPTILQST